MIFLDTGFLFALFVDDLAKVNLPVPARTHGEGALKCRVRQAMSKVTIDLDDALAALLQQTHMPVQQAAQEMIVLELYRRGTISSGKAAELLGTSRIAFLQRASSLGVPFFDMTEDEWAAEQASLNCQ